MEIATFNVNNINQRLPNLSEWLKDASPDVVCVLALVRDQLPGKKRMLTGHSLKIVHRILERYLARVRDLAEEAISNFENSPRTKFAHQLQTRARKNKRSKKKVQQPQQDGWRAGRDSNP